MTRMRTGAACIAAFALAIVAKAQTLSPTPSAATAQASLPNATAALQIKYVRDSAEYAALTGQTFRQAQAAIARALPPADQQVVWCAVLDIDETVLDNSVYQLERAAYGLPYDPASWLAWTSREEAAAVPGATEFAAQVHGMRGRIAYISNRTEAERQATLANLAAKCLWKNGDLLCLATDSKAYTKEARRKELRASTGPCSWSGVVPKILVFLGDQIGDFPAGDEETEAKDPAAFGTRYFLLPNPMYGGWAAKVTRHY